MKPLVEFQSFTSRITTSIIITAAIVFLVLGTFIEMSTESGIAKESHERIMGILENTGQRIDGVLTETEAVLRNYTDMVRVNRGDPDYMYYITQWMVERNPLVKGASVAFEPGYFPQMGRYFAPYTFRSGDTLVSKQLGSKDYEYHYMDWYQIPKLLDTPYWSDPYIDKGGEVPMITYSLPLTDDNGRMFAIITADVSLDELTELMDSVHYYKGDYNFIIGRGGVFITHPTREFILNEGIFSYAAAVGDTLLRNIGYNMIDGFNGSGAFVDQNVGDSQIFFAPIKRTGWSIAIVCPTAELKSVANKTILLIFLMMALGLLLLGFVCHKSIGHMMRPLEHFADSADEIAAGCLDAPLPDISTNDEMGRLHSSFAMMQTSLANQMEELKKVNEAKGRIESELQIARSIQLGMVPQTFPMGDERIELFGSMTPAKEVGGDLYDYAIVGYRLYFCIGDVSGKGVPASLFMTTTINLFRVSVQQQMTDPAMIANQINATMSENNEKCMFVTLFIGIADLNTGHLDFCNAGHNPPVLKDKFVNVQPNSPIGFWPDFEFVGESIDSIKGVPFLLYTDGLNEAENERQEQFGEDTILKILAGHKFTTCEDTVSVLKKEVFKHRGNAEPSDDLTMLCIHIK